VRTYQRKNLPVLKFLLLASASIAIATAAFVGLGYAAHDGGATPYQNYEFSGI
jgi:hypothetical protein